MLRHLSFRLSSRPVTMNTGQDNSKCARSRRQRANAQHQRWGRYLVEVVPRKQGVREQPVGDLCAHLCHRLTHHGDEDPRCGLFHRFWSEHRRPEPVDREIAFERETATRAPASPHSSSAPQRFSPSAARVDAGMPKRFSMWLWIWVPSPRMKRPREKLCRSQPREATVMGLRAKATAMLVPRAIESVCSAAKSSGRNGSWLISPVQQPS